MCSNPIMGAALWRVKQKVNCPAGNDSVERSPSALCASGRLAGDFRLRGRRSAFVPKAVSPGLTRVPFSLRSRAAESVVSDADVMDLRHCFQGVVARSRGGIIDFVQAC